MRYRAPKNNGGVSPRRVLTVEAPCYRCGVRNSKRNFAGLSLLLIALLVGSCGPSEDEPANAAGASPTAAEFTQLIRFNASSNTEAYRVSGWSHPEADFTWTEGTSAKIALPVPKTDNALELKIVMAAFIHPPELPKQPVELYAGDSKIAEWQVADTAEYVAPLPRDLTKNGGTLTIELRTPKATSPKAAGVSADPRVLGACVHYIQLRKAGA